MSNTKALIATGDVEAIIQSIQPAALALQQQRQIIDVTTLVVSVANEDEEKKAIEAASLAQGFKTEVEKSRKEVKEPFLDAGKQIDATARKIVDPVVAEYSRITALVSKYRSDLNAKLEAERERLRKEQQAIEDARQKLAQEKRELALREEEARRSANDAELKRIEAAKLDQEFAAAELQDRQDDASKTVIDDRPMEGAAARKEYEIEVIDPIAFFAVHPEFCEITVKKNPIKEWAKTQWDGKPIPGIKITEKLQTAVRGVKPGLALK